jgi:nucleotidyltransferase substrate binding protein (TIGR01987 family)
MTRFVTTALRQAIVRLESGLEQCSASPADELARDGAIQRFEYTMDLCWKLLQRYLKDLAQVGEEAIRTKRDLFREGARLGLLDSAEAWFGHYEARNETSHTYDGVVAGRVFERAKLFVTDARQLLERLQDAARRAA